MTVDNIRTFAEAQQYPASDLSQMPLDEFAWRYIKMTDDLDVQDYRTKDVSVLENGEIVINGRPYSVTLRAMKKFVSVTPLEEQKGNAEVKRISSMARRGCDFTFTYGDDELMWHYMSQFTGKARSGRPLLLRTRNVLPNDVWRGDTQQIMRTALSDRYGMLDAKEFIEILMQVFKQDAGLKSMMRVYKTGWTNPDWIDLRLGFPELAVPLGYFNGRTDGDTYTVGLRFRNNHVGNGTANVTVGIMNTQSAGSLVFSEKINEELLGFPSIRITHSGSESRIKRTTLAAVRDFYDLFEQSMEDGKGKAVFMSMAAAVNEPIDWDASIAVMKRSFRLTPEELAIVNMAAGKHGKTASAAINGIVDVSVAEAGTERGDMMGEMAGGILANYHVNRTSGTLSFNEMLKKVDGLPGTNVDDDDDEA